ncbi:MAG: hypothetical protein GEU79_04495 [Acidimicrobiia bacterium]|nr:hypothetical protein [Acidimicrobiia bacterium]
MSDDLTLRTLIIAIVVLLLVVIWLVLRRPRPLRLLEENALRPGIHLFTSERCKGCDELRRSLVDALGPDSYTEHPELHERELFASAGVDMIPVVVTVTEGERPRMWKDMPPRRVLERASQHR